MNVLRFLWIGGGLVASKSDTILESSPYIRKYLHHFSGDSIVESVSSTEQNSHRLLGSFNQKFQLFF